ncbi:MAG: hypothetical protein AB7U83_15655 [Vicinamibacterales bacterium]
MRRVTLACTLLLSLIAAGCGDNDDNTDTGSTPTEPSDTVTDTFSGTLTRNGGTSHPFPVISAAGGDVVATLRSVSPDSSTVLGMALGTWNGTSCQAVIANDRAVVSASILGRATSVGTLCLRIYDVGTVVEPQDYEVEVVHP